MKHSDIEISRELETLVPQENEAQRILRKALKNLGPDGENWNNSWRARSDDGKVCFGCAIKDAGEYTTFFGSCDSPAAIALNKASRFFGHANFILMNECPGLPFQTVRDLFAKAIELAGAEIPSVEMVKAAG